MIDQLANQGFAIESACETLGVARSGYYAHRQQQPSPRRQHELALLPWIEHYFWLHRRRYGVRRLHRELNRHGHVCGRDQVRRLLQELGLKAIQPRSFQPRTTNSRHTLGYSPNLLLEAGMPCHINRVWVDDITYLPKKSGGFLYLALLMDLFSRRVVGWSVEEHMEESLVVTALRHALRQRQPQAGLIHHTDRGGQYAGRQLRALLLRAGLKQSMSAADDDYGNVFMESCFSTLKRELPSERFTTREQAQRILSDYLDRYYNTKRLHSSLGYVSPAEFERQHAS